MGSRQAEKAPAAEQGSAPDSLQPRAPAGDQAGGAASPDAADALDNRSGGPDGFGYTFDDNESHPAHGRQWQDISGTGEVLAQGDIDVGGIAGGGLDDGYWQISFPFPFKFYGSDRNGDDLFISTNGFVTFDSSGANSFSNVPIPDGNNDPEDAVYAFWDDLTAGTSALTCGANPGDLDCGIYWQVVGSAPNRRLIVQWNEVPFVADADAGHVTFQIQLLEATGEIRVEYLDPQDCALDDCERGSGGEATIGIEADDGTTGLQYSFNEPALMSKPGTFIQNVVFHPPHLEVTKNCFAPETELHNAPAGGTAEVVLAGQQWICRIQVTNHGSFPVPNVQVTDAIPANTRLLYSGRPSVPAVPVAGAADVTFDVGIVPGNDSVSWELGFIVDADYLIQPPPPYPAEDEICNDAMITNPMTLAYSPSREQDRDCDVVKDRADLRVSKLVEPFTSVRAGDIFTYTIYVDNLGPSAARNVTITDTLLSSANVSIQSCAFSVSQGGGAITQFTCTTGNLVSTQFGTDVGTFRTSFLEPLTPTSQGRIRASFRLVARQAMDLTNTVRVSANTPDPDMSNNFAVTNLSVTSVADVFVTKTDAAANPDAGEQFTYTIEAGNNGPSTAENTVVTDVLPLELEVVSIAVGAVGPPPAGGAGSCATTQSAAGNEVVTCNLGSLLGNLAANTPQRQIAITVRVKEGTPNGTNLFNEVRVSSDEFDDDNRNNIDVEVTPVGQLSDFTLRKVCTPDPVTAGGVLHCGYQITNNGPSTANNVIFEDTWLNGGEFVKLISANVQGHGGADTCYQEDLNGATQVRCSFGDVPVGRTFRLDLEFAVDPSTPDGTSLDNCFVIDADSPVTFNPPANRCESTEVDGVSTVLITKVASDPSPVAGTDYSYKYTVKNNGPSTAFDVTVTDTLPDGLSFVSVNDARCSESGGQVTCNFGDMLPGATITFDIFVRLDADFACGDTLTNNVRVRWDANDDGTLDSESVSVSEVLVDCVSDLRVSKVGKPDNVVDEDELLTYTIVVDNHGPSFADAAAIKDLIAASGQFDVEAVSSDRPATCNSLPAPIGGNPFVPANALTAGTGQTGNLSNLYQLDCTLDDPLGVLAADGPPNSGRWIVQIAVDGDEPGSINNAVTALSGSLDPDQSNNVAVDQQDRPAGLRPGRRLAGQLLRHDGQRRHRGHRRVDG
ncbi:MAG: DUF11 domain-containing protein [Chloroflexi bacterium CFX6]|nr:DUF11 domain-containing protein [Chloroflexi bacterium CFX6]